MIRCDTRGLFSWRYRVFDERTTCLLDFDWRDESGTLEIEGGDKLRIAPDPDRGWVAWRGDEQVFVGRRSGHDPVAFTLQRSAMAGLRARSITRTGRTFLIEAGGRLVGKLAPVHLLTRRARIHTETDDYDVPSLAFLFWMVVVSWRRAVGDV